MAHHKPTCPRCGRVVDALDSDGYCFFDCNANEDICGHYYNPRNGWTFDISWFKDGTMEIRSSGMPAYYMTIDGARRFAATLERA